MLIDSHSHLHFPVYKDDVENVLARMKDKNVATFTVGTSYQNSLEAVEFSKNYSIPCSVGFHPSHARPTGVAGYLDPTEEVCDEEFDVGKLRDLLRKEYDKDVMVSLSNQYVNVALRQAQSDRSKIVAIGECGLDYFRLPDDESLKKQFKQKQREAFEAQIQLAQEFKLPLIIHTRASKEDPEDAYQDTLGIIAPNFKFQTSSPGVMHCYLGNVEYAKKFLDLGLFLSFSGIVTFKKANTVRESAMFCPADRMLTETDCPYLAPEPYRGKQNEPAYVEFVLRKLEELKKESLEVQIEESFKSLFSL